MLNSGADFLWGLLDSTYWSAHGDSLMVTNFNKPWGEKIAVKIQGKRFLWKSFNNSKPWNWWQKDLGGRKLTRNAPHLPGQQLPQVGAKHGSTACPQRSQHPTSLVVNWSVKWRGRGGSGGSEFEYFCWCCPWWRRREGVVVVVVGGWVPKTKALIPPKNVREAWNFGLPVLFRKQTPCFVVQPWNEPSHGNVDSKLPDSKTIISLHF